MRRPNSLLSSSRILAASFIDAALDEKLLRRCFRKAATALSMQSFTRCDENASKVLRVFPVAGFTVEIATRYLAFFISDFGMRSLGRFGSLRSMSCQSI